MNQELLDIIWASLTLAVIGMGTLFLAAVFFRICF